MFEYTFQETVDYAVQVARKKKKNMSFLQEIKQIYTTDFCLRARNAGSGTDTVKTERRSAKERRASR